MVLRRAGGRKKRRRTKKVIMAALTPLCPRVLRLESIPENRLESDQTIQNGHSVPPNGHVCRVTKQYVSSFLSVAGLQSEFCFVKSQGTQNSLQSALKIQRPPPFFRHCSALLSLLLRSLLIAFRRRISQTAGVVGTPAASSTCRTHPL